MEVCHWHWLQLQHHLAILEPCHKARNGAEGAPRGLGKNSNWLLLVNLYCNVTFLAFSFVTDDNYLKLEGLWVWNLADPYPTVIWLKVVSSWILIDWFFMLTCYYYHDDLNEQWLSNPNTGCYILLISLNLKFFWSSRERCIFLFINVIN